MPASRNFRNVDTLNEEADLSSDLDDEPQPVRSAHGKGKQPASVQAARTMAAVAKRARPEPDDDDEVGGSLDYESDGELGAIVQTLMATAAKRTKQVDAKLEMQAQQQREMAFKDASEKLKEAKLKHDGAYAADSKSERPAEASALTNERPHA